MGISAAPEVDWLLDSGAGERERLVAAVVGHPLCMKSKKMNSKMLKLIGLVLPSQSLGQSNHRIVDPFQATCLQYS